MRPHIWVLVLLSTVAFPLLPHPAATAAASEQVRTDSVPTDDPYFDHGSWVDQGEDDAWEPGQDEALPDPGSGSTGQPALRGVKYRAEILAYSRQYNLRAALVASIIHNESAFNRKAKSRAGARGLMQLMPATARWLGGKTSKLYLVSYNISLGTKYLAYLRTVVGNSTQLMAAAYNAGPGAVKKHKGVPPYKETRTYVTRVIRMEKVYARR